VKYLGRGDQHDPKYNSLAMFKKLNETMKVSRYSGAPLDSEYCPFTIYLYPSDEYQSMYITNNAIVFSISVVLIFAFVSLVFFIYDFTVERRQKVVLDTAEKTNAIVSSLFPSAIRDQMLHDNATNGPTSTFKSGGKRFVKAGDSDESGLIASNITSTKALASLYPETTIFFADLSGFTAWSR
jgi:hypothetical protein